MAEPRVLVVLLNYRTADMTLLAAEAALREMGELDAEMVIVDNDSGDGSFEKLRKAALERGWADQGKVRVVASGCNGGYGAGNNFGIQQNMSDNTKPDYIYCLNSDAFPNQGAIRALVDILESRSELGLAGSYIEGPDGDPHQTAFRFPSIASEFEGAARTGLISRLLWNSIVALRLPERTVQVDWVAGASLMMRRSMLDEIGYFDETFFLYYEETDLCRRADLAGYRTIYVRESKVTHIGSVSTGMKEWHRIPGYWFDSRRHYFTKNHGRAYAMAATLAHIAGALIWRLRCLISGRKSNAPERFLRDLIRHSLDFSKSDKSIAPSILAKARAVD